MGRAGEASLPPASYGWRFRSVPFARRARACRTPAAQYRQKPSGSGCAGSPECLLEIEIWAQLLDGAVEARSCRTHGAAHDCRHIFERHVEIGVEDDHETLLIAEAWDGGPPIGA